MPFYHFFFGLEGSPTKIDRKKSTLVLTSLLEDLAVVTLVSNGLAGSQKEIPAPFLANTPFLRHARLVTLINEAKKWVVPGNRPFP